MSQDYISMEEFLSSKEQQIQKYGNNMSIIDLNDYFKTTRFGLEPISEFDENDLTTHECNTSIYARIDHCVSLYFNENLGCYEITFPAICAKLTIRVPNDVQEFWFDQKDNVDIESLYFNSWRGKEEIMDVFNFLTADHSYESSRKTFSIERTNTTINEH